MRGLACCNFLVPGGVARAITGLKASGSAAAKGGSLLICSCPTSRCGQTKSSARPAGGGRGSPFVRGRAAKGSSGGGRGGGPPGNWLVPTEGASSGTIGPASGLVTAFVFGLAGSVGNAICGE